MQVFQIRKPSLYSFDETLWFLDRGLDDCMHQVRDKTVRRLFEQSGKPVLTEVSENAAYLEIKSLYGEITGPEEIISFVRDWFDLDRDIRPFYRLLAKDRFLGGLVQKYSGFRIVGIPDLYEALVWAIMGQQINLAFAYTLKRRFVEAFGRSVIFESQPYYLFPEPGEIRHLNIETFRSMQFTNRKAEYILHLSELFSEGKISKEQLSLFDEEQMMNVLTQIRGIGEWSANYALMKSMRAMNRVPFGDAGLNQAMQQFMNIPKKNNRQALEAVFQKYEGWKTYLVFYLWRSQRDKLA